MTRDRESTDLAGAAHHAADAPAWADGPTSLDALTDEQYERYLRATCSPIFTTSSPHGHSADPTGPLRDDPGAAAGQPPSRGLNLNAGQGTCRPRCRSERDADPVAVDPPVPGSGFTHSFTAAAHGGEEPARTPVAPQAAGAGPLPTSARHPLDAS